MFIFPAQIADITAPAYDHEALEFKKENNLNVLYPSVYMTESSQFLLVLVTFYLSETFTFM